MVGIIVHPVSVIHPGSPVPGMLSFENSPEGPALHGRRCGSTRIVQEHWRKVYVQTDVVRNGIRLDCTGVPDEERHAQRFFVHQSLVEKSVVAEEEALV